MKLFIASHSQEAAKQLMDRLHKSGHVVTSRWIKLDTKFSHGLKSYSDDEKTQVAQMDEEDVRAATDGLVLIAETSGRPVPGGKHVETGIALALGHPVYVIGSRENVFHWHPCVRVFPNEDAFLTALA